MACSGGSGSLSNHWSSGGAVRTAVEVFLGYAMANKNYACLKLLYELQIVAAQNPSAYAPYLQRNASTRSALIGTALSEAKRSHDHLAG